MDNSLTLARYFARLVWLLVHEAQSVSDQKAALRAVVTVSKESSVRLRNKEGRLAVNGLVMPQALTGVQELAARLAVHSIEEIEIDPKKVHEKLLPGYQKAQKQLQLMIGSPKTVIPKMKAILTTLRPGSLIVFNVQGPVSNQDRQTSMRLIANEIIPVLKEYADSIGLVDAITKKPGGTKARAGVKRNPVSDRGMLKELGLA